MRNAPLALSFVALAARAALLVLAACEPSPDHADECVPTNAFERLEAEASSAASTAYTSAPVASCPELDAPADGLTASPGLTAEEYAWLLRNANGNFFDDGVWWLKAAPRGETHVEPMEIVDSRCEVLRFESFGYDYSSALPALGTPPSCGRYLVGVQAGRRLEDRWPQVFGLEGSGLTRLAPLRSSPVFGTFLHLMGGPPSSSGMGVRIARVEVVRHEEHRLELVARAEGGSFASAARLVLSPGDPTRLSVEAVLYRRTDPALPSQLPVASLGAIFVRGASGRKDGGEAHDADQLVAVTADGESLATAFDDPMLEGGADGWTRVPIADDRGFASFALVQSTRDASVYADDTGARYAERPDVTISDIRSDAPLSLVLSRRQAPASGGNAVASLLVDAASRVPIHVSYVVTAALP